MLAQWNHDQIARPNDQITEALLGVWPPENKFCYFEASPLAYATTHGNATSFLLTWDTKDDVVDWKTQSLHPIGSQNFCGLALIVRVPAGHNPSQVGNAQYTHKWTRLLIKKLRKPYQN